MANICTTRPSWRKWPVRGTTTRSAPSGLDARVVATMRARPGPRERPGGRPPACLRVRVDRRLLRGARVAVAGCPDVVERQRRAARADADALHDPRLRRPDVERLEEGVRDLVLGMEVAEAVQE